MRNYERWPGLAHVDEVAQVTVVGLDVGLTRSDALAFEPREPPIEYDLPLLAQLVRATRIVGQEDADHADSAGEAHRSHEVVHRHVWVLVALRVVCLVAYALAALIGPLTIGLRQHLVDRRGLRVVDGNHADRFRETQPVGVAVDDHDLAGVLKDRGVRGHEPDRSRAIDDDGVTGLHTGELGGVPASRKDVGDHHVVVLLLPSILRQPQAVEVTVGNAEVLGLTAGVGPHVGKAVGGAGHLRVRVGGEAKGGQSGLAVPAEAAADVERYADHVANLYPIDGAADLDHLTEVLVPDYP